MKSGAACVAPHLRWLHRAGYWRGAPPAPSRAHAAYRSAVLGIVACYMLQETVYAWQMRDDMNELARVMFLLLCHVTSLVKQLVLAARADSVDALLVGMAAAGAASGGHAPLQRRTARRAARLQRVFAGMALLTCTLWLVFPLAARARGHLVSFPFWLPLQAQAPLRFTLVLLYQYYVTSLVGVGNTTMDAFIATVLYECQTQLRILRLNFENLMERAEETCKQTHEDLEEVALRLFKEGLNHYEKIINTVDKLQDIFGGAIFIQFAVGGWILCMAVYKLVSLSILGIEFASMTLFISCILLELFLYCYYGNEVTVESAALVASVFASGWWRGGRRRARGALLLLTRAARPARPAALRFVPLSLETFLKILKSSYSIYAVLHQTKEK